MQSVTLQSVTLQSVTLQNVLKCRCKLYELAHAKSAKVGQVVFDNFEKNTKNWFYMLDGPLSILYNVINGSSYMDHLNLDIWDFLNVIQTMEKMGYR